MLLFFLSLFGVWFYESVTGYRYIILSHICCFAVQTGFYSDAVECWICIKEFVGSIAGRVRSEEFYL